METHSEAIQWWRLSFLFWLTRRRLLERAACVAHRQDHLPFLKKLGISHCFCITTKAANFSQLPRTSIECELNMLLAAECQVHIHLLVQWRLRRGDWGPTGVLDRFLQPVKLHKVGRLQCKLGKHSPRFAAFHACNASTDALGGGDACWDAWCCLLCCFAREWWTTGLSGRYALKWVKCAEVTIACWVWLWVRKPVQVLEDFWARFFADSRWAWGLSTLSNLHAVQIKECKIRTTPHIDHTGKRCESNVTFWMPSCTAPTRWYTE